jgi:predicted transcriptional regulator
MEKDMRFIKAANIIKNYNGNLNKYFMPLPSGEDLRVLRKRLCLTMRDVKKETGIPISTISRFENNCEVSFSSVKKIHDYYIKLNG